MGKDNGRTEKDIILVIDDDRDVLGSIVTLLKNAKYKCITASSSEEGIRLIQEKRPLIVLTDLKMETETSGLDVLIEAKKIDPDVTVLLYTAYGNVPVAVDAFKKGAFDFIQKVSTHHDIILPIERAFKYAKMQRENVYLKSRLEPADDKNFHGAIGTSSGIREVFEKAKRIAMTNATVLITGETGTGKELIVRGIHLHSRRAEESFVPVVVGALPDNLLEEEMFGHVKGSFTGAATDKPGLFEAADKGTIFLDEIGEVNFEMQHKLLRVLQERKVRRVGSVKEREIDVRIISATNQEPAKLIKDKKLRKDLFYRLNVVRIHIPPLRERREDVPVLAYHFLKKFQDTGLVEVVKISSETLMFLQQYDWPGNVRELQGVIETMVALAKRPELRPDDLPDFIRPSSKHVIVQPSDELDFKASKARIIAEFEKQYIEGLLQKYDGNISRVAEVAGLNRKTIYRLIAARKIKFSRLHAEMVEA